MAAKRYGSKCGIPCHPERSLPLNSAVKPVGGFGAAANPAEAAKRTAKTAIDRRKEGVAKPCMKVSSSRTAADARFGTRRACQKNLQPELSAILADGAAKYQTH